MRLDWSNDVAVCIASGPSLKREQVNYVYGRAKVIAVNNNWELAPWADVLYACDVKWWNHYRGVPEFFGVKYSLEPTIFEDVHQLKDSGGEEFAVEWPEICTGVFGNSGLQAINLAYHFGARKIILLGYDMQYTNGKKHWHPDHPSGMNNANPVIQWVENFERLAPILADKGLNIINCTRKTALKCFPQAEIRKVL